VSFNSISIIYANKDKIMTLPFVDILIKIYELWIKKTLSETERVNLIL